ncbi:MAG: AraC family transcriptional regulator [Pedobacter sp.]|nr:MAG: AraC family transcriptional regulator [Pedobacter sp.]
MSIKVIEEFHIVGISVRTTNEDGKSGIDIPKLWEVFLSENIADKIPNKIDSSIYCLYTDYEKDHLHPYTTILGCKVENLSAIPASMVGKTISSGQYETIPIKGELSEGLVFKEWQQIWASDRARAYTTDFEVYFAKAPEDGQNEVEINLAID